MPHPALLQRLEGIHMQLRGVHVAGGGMSSATKGDERRAFIDYFLAQVFPPPFRFGTGDCIDQNAQRSGELDVVMEYPFLPSLPVGGSSRLYLAEGVAAVFEVKSNLAAQWDQVKKTADQLRPLRRRFASSMTFGQAPSDRLPLFAIGYTGWNTTDTLRARCQELAIDEPL